MHLKVRRSSAPTNMYSRLFLTNSLENSPPASLRCSRTPTCTTRSSTLIRRPLFISYEAKKAPRIGVFSNAALRGVSDASSPNSFKSLRGTSQRPLKSLKN
ncbi:hypothetical protein [Microvirus mar35]|uniref:Uncharacterized protein n=1 Tax=Microvirus mar35 TaxID=2851169 RepID=A0A8F5RC22_9VIRU|nr:hypothetical protein [Microvirus mar35]